MTPVASTVRRLRTASAVEQWSLANAGAVLGGAGLSVWLEQVWPLVAVGTAMLGLLVLVARTDWTPDGRFGRANGLTTGRLGLLCALPFLPADAPVLCIAVGLAILIADGIDGWMARRYELSSEFGEFFDKETDALFLLLLCAIAAFQKPLPDAVLLLGLLRYLFVFVLFLGQPTETKEQRSNAARYIYVAMILALLTTFLPYPLLYQPLVALAGTALIASFARSLWWLVGSGSWESGGA